MKKLCYMLVAAAYIVSGAAFAGEIVTNDTVLQMAHLQLGDELIVRKIQASICQFDTSPTTLVKLKQAGLSQVVIGAMIGAGSSSAGHSPGTTDTIGLATGSTYEPWAAVPVRLEHSNPRRWIPYYGSFSTGNNTFFVTASESKRKLGSPRPAFISSIDPARLKLVLLAVSRHGDRYVVFSDQKTDHEVQTISEALGSTSSWRLSPAADLPEGDYAWLVSPPPMEGHAQGWFVAFTAYDFAVTKK